VAANVARFLLTKSINISKCSYFWMYCMLPCSQLLHFTWFFPHFISRYFNGRTTI